MNVASYVQQRQYGFKRSRQTSQRKVENFVETKLTKSFVNKACEVSGRCRSTFVMQFSCDGTKVASTHGDHSVRVTEIATGKCLHTLRGHPRTPWSLAYHPSYCNILASGCLGGQVRIWDLYGHGCEVWNTENEAVVASLTFHPTDQVLVVAAGNTVYFWDWTKPEPFAKCSTSHEYERIRWIHFDSLGQTLYSGISNNTSVHRDELSSVSHSGEEVRQPSSQPSRLGSVYNNIVNYYQDYRRDRLICQLGPAGSTGATRAQQSGSTTLTASAGVGQMGPTGMPAAPGVSGLHLSTGMTDTTGVSQLLPTDLATIPGNDDDTVTPASPDDSGSRPFLTGMSILPAIDPVLGISHASRPTDPRAFPERTRQRGRWRCSVYRRNRTPRRTGHAQPSTQSIFGSLSETEGDPLLNPRNDPLLSSANESVNSELENQSAGVAAEVDISERQLRTSVRRFLNESSLGGQNLPAIDVTEEIEIPLEAVTGQYIRPQASCSQDSSVSTHQTNNSSDLSDAVNNANRSCVVSVSHADTSHSIDSSQSITSSAPSLNISHSNSKTNTSAFLSGYLQRLTQKSGATATSNTTVSSHSKIFPSIRERLQSSVPLCPVTSSDSKAKISVVQTTGIPKVTVIMSSHTDSCPQVSGQGHHLRIGLEDVQVPGPGVSRLCTLSQSRLNYPSLSTCSSASVTPAAENVRQTQSVTASVSTVVGARPRVSTIACPRSARNSDENLPSRDLTIRSLQSSGINSSGLWMPASATCNTAVSSSCQRNSSTAPSIAINTPTVVASTSSQSALFQNIFHSSSAVVQSSGGDSGQHPSRARNYCSTFHSQPYNWQNRNRYLSLMGPYLQSRGVNPSVSEHTSGPIEDAISQERIIATMQSTGRDSASIQRDQASSDTENELSAHLSGSGAYFMPIPEHQLRTASSTSLRSSTSLERSTDPSGLRQYSVSAESTGSSQGQRSESAHSQGSRSGSSQNQRSRSNSQDNEVELVVDQNENYTTNRNVNPDDHQREEIVHRSHDRNNNSIHISVNNNPTSNTASQRVDQRDPDYVRLRNSFVSMTDQIEREMNDLNRRINALRDSFNESIRSLRHDRHRYETIDGQLPAETATNLGPQDVSDSPALAVTSELDQDDNVHRGSEDNVAMSQPPTLLETSLRTHTQGRQPLHPRSQVEGENDPQDDTHHWRTLQRNYLHAHYSSSILDETINRPNNMIQSAINRAIAGAFMGTGESAVANNIINQTHRIQYWDFTKCAIPDISQSKVNIVVAHCKLHNSASADVSQDNSLLATFVPNHHGFPDNNILAVYSLVPDTRGQCLYTKQFGPNAVSVSISPSNNYILVCLAAKRLTWVFTSQQLVAHVYKLEKKKAGEKSMKHVKDVHHTCSSDIRTHVSGNSACWLPLPGQGLVYGTNRGDLHICRPGVKVVTGKADSVDSDMNLDDLSSDSSFQRLFGPVPWRLYASPNRVSTSTQTAGVRRSAGTQTPQDT